MQGLQTLANHTEDLGSSISTNSLKSRARHWNHKYRDLTSMHPAVTLMHTLDKDTMYAVGKLSWKVSIPAVTVAAHRES